LRAMDLRRERSSATTRIKHYARILQRRARAAEPEALRSLRALREFRDADPQQISRSVRREHCLTAGALQLGFRSWRHALEVLEGQPEDFGTLLYPGSCQGHWNIWSAHYNEAREIRAAHGGYLLPYRRQFLIVDRDYIDSLGLDPDHPAWNRMGRDWVQPPDRVARAQLYELLVQNALVMQVMRER
jgi:hypothetical protein